MKGECRKKNNWSESQDQFVEVFEKAGIKY
jgi:hypothetical protein